MGRLVRAGKKKHREEKHAWGIFFNFYLVDGFDLFGINEIFYWRLSLEFSF